jgi:hypothetical protein
MWSLNYTALSCLVRYMLGYVGSVCSVLQETQHSKYLLHTSLVRHFPYATSELINMMLVAPIKCPHNGAVQSCNYHVFCLCYTPVQFWVKYQFNNTTLVYSLSQFEEVLWTV